MENDEIVAASSAVVKQFVEICLLLSIEGKSCDTLAVVLVAMYIMRCQLCEGALWSGFWMTSQMFESVIIKKKKVCLTDSTECRTCGFEPNFTWRAAVC